MNLLLDTDILISFLRGDRRIRNLLQFDDRFFYSYITRKELLRKQGLSARQRETVLALLNRLRQIPIDGPIATLAEELLRRYSHRGLRIPDALIAATAMVRKAVLVTFNQRHFRFIEGLSLFPIERLKET